MLPKLLQKQAIYHLLRVRLPSHHALFIDFNEQQLFGDHTHPIHDTPLRYIKSSRQKIVLQYE